MAERNYTTDFSRDAAGAQLITWGPLAPGDTATPLSLGLTEGLGAAFSVTGAFGGATVVLQVSNDKINWFTHTLNGVAVSLAAAGLMEVSTGAAYTRPAIVGGAGSAITAVLSIRPQYGLA